jgi:hypothetical protein
MKTVRYNIADFDTFFNSPEYKCADSYSEIENIITYLEKITAESTDEFYPTKNISTKPYKKIYPPSSQKPHNYQSHHATKNKVSRNHTQTHSHSHNKSPSSTVNTNTNNIVFAKKPIQQSDGVVKDINDIRIILNKMSESNFNSQKDIIICKLGDIMSKDGDDLDGHIKNVAKFVFDVACSNKFFAELYAKLYKDLSIKFCVFTTVLTDFTDNYKQSIKDIIFVDPDVDYDSFCEYTKNNDKRRATALFIIMLVKNDSLTAELSIDLILYFIKLFKEFVIGEEKNNEVDELTELIFIFMMNGKDFLNKLPEWKNAIKSFIFDYSKYKPFELESLSSRTLFKLKDLKLIYE